MVLESNSRWLYKKFKCHVVYILIMKKIIDLDCFIVTRQECGFIVIVTKKNIKIDITQQSNVAYFLVFWKCNYGWTCKNRSILVELHLLPFSLHLMIIELYIYYVMIQGKALRQILCKLIGRLGPLTCELGPPPLAVAGGIQAVPSGVSAHAQPAPPQSHANAKQSLDLNRNPKH